MFCFFNISKSNRLPYLLIIALVSIGFLLIIPVSSAETLKVISNTDRCIYQPGKKMDYCKTVYELCAPALDMNKVYFKFKIEEDKALKSQITGLSYNYSSKIGKTNCRIITIDGYKNPYKNVDNVLCYDTYCHENYIWWNTSFLSKFAINASINSGVVTMPLLLNDSFITIDGFDQYVWCNYTLNTTRQIVGYFYFTNSTFYQCVDRTETFAVGMQVDNGNGSLMSSNPFDKDMFVGSHLTRPLINGEDSSIYGNNCTKNGDPQTVNAQISKGADLNSVGDWYSCGDIDTYGNNLTLMIWVNFDTIPNFNMPLVAKWSGGGFQPFMMNVVRSLSGSNPKRAQIQGDSWVGTGTTILTTGIWNHITGIRNDTHACIYLNGALENCDAIGVGVTFNAIPIDIGHDSGGNTIDAQIDEYRLYNRTLSSDEIRAIYENQNGTFGIARSEPVINLSLNVSVKHFDIDVPSFLITSQQYQTIINDTFTLLDSINLIIKGSGGAMKENGGGATSLVSARLIFNGITLYDQTIRSIRGSSDRGVFTLPLINVTGQGGTNTFILQMKRTGIDDINISNFGFHIDTTLSSNNNNITVGLSNLAVNYTSTSFLNIANFTINKTTNSTVLIDIEHTFESTSNGIVADCFLESEQTGEITLTYSRWLQFSGNVGSSGMNHRSQNDVNGLETWMMFCKSSTNNLMLNNITVFIMNQQDVINDSIRGFQNSTSISGLTGSGNLVLSSNHINLGGPQLELLTTIIMQSTSGSQDGSDSPVFIVRTNDSVCNISIERSIASNSDIGTAKIYLNCGNLTIGVNNNYEVLVDVSGGNTLNILNISLSTYETTPQLVIEGVVAPIVRIISPLNGSIIFETIDIDALVIDLSRTGWQSIIQIINASDIIISTILNETSFENTTTAAFNTRTVDNGNYTIFWFVSNNEGNNSDNITIIIRNIEIPAPPTISFCVNDDLLLTRDSTRTTSNGNVTIEIIDRITFCPNGCSNSTISNWGFPGCIESDLTISIFILAFVIIAAFLIWVVQR